VVVFHGETPRAARFALRDAGTNRFPALPAMQVSA
jgi:hypothetical protein